MNLKSMVVAVDRIVEDDIQQNLMCIHGQAILLRDKFIHFRNLQMNYNTDQHGSEQIGTVVDEINLGDLLYMVIEMVDFVVSHENNVYIKNHVDSH